MYDLLSLSASQLNRAADLKEKIQALENELASLFSSSLHMGPKRGPGRPRKDVVITFADTNLKRKRRKMSVAARAKIAAAARQRWAKTKAAGKNTL